LQFIPTAGRNPYPLLSAYGRPLGRLHEARAGEGNIISSISKRGGVVICRDEDLVRRIATSIRGHTEDLQALFALRPRYRGYQRCHNVGTAAPPTQMPGIVGTVRLIRHLDQTSTSSLPTNSFLSMTPFLDHRCVYSDN
jgi:hypothetical protein